MKGIACEWKELSGVSVGLIGSSFLEPSGDILGLSSEPEFGEESTDIYDDEDQAKLLQSMRLWIPTEKCLRPNGQPSPNRSYGRGYVTIQWQVRGRPTDVQMCQNGQPSHRT